MLDFALLPPEVNSTLMYSGPGSGSMLAAAAAWQALGAELQCTANSYRSLLSGLVSGPWSGPAAAAMSAAAAPHLAWLSATAAQAEQVGRQAAAAASAYEAAFAGIVPPAVVAANRAMLATLVATNLFGQNTPAIAVVEAEYAEMWAQDANAMYQYAATAAAAADLTSFVPPRPATTANGPAAQAAAVGRATGDLLAGDAQSLQQLVEQLPNALRGLSEAALVPSLERILRALGLIGWKWTPNGDGIVLSGALGALVAGLTGSSTLDASTLSNTYIRLVSPFRLTTTALKDIDGLSHSLFPAAAHAGQEAAKAVEALPQALPKLPLSGVSSGLGGIGRAAQIGGLSVPNAWASSMPGLGRVATVPLSSVAAAAAAADPSQHVFGGLPAHGTPARGFAASAAPPRYGFHPRVMTRPPAAG
ncbi:PPE family protein [Mycobacterium marinum]|uniref:PPE family protein n=1 Tax=Mycobacterium marinum TaxID=1781 RepID=UPI002358E928|nr:PPE family protein [Mycobacterium marinum]MDC8982091.1 PPE family protein [Mycobacterium marinum]MDC8998813.1 PPE family protein [Mycobacterium marinum]MDC9009680.1 PPE family protein [Mycobacterium marinum]